MGTLRHRSIRYWVALAGMAAVGAASLTVLGSSIASALGHEIVLTAGTPISGGEGNGTGAVTVAHFTDSNTVACALTAVAATIYWGDGASNPGSISCEKPAQGVPVYTVTGGHNYVDAGTYNVVVSARDLDDGNVKSGQTDTAAISDESLFNSERSSANLSGVEGGQFNLTAYFFDENGSFDAQLKATIDWGDGSAISSGTVADNNCDCSGTELKVTGSHTYDAPTTSGQKYEVTVTLTDDGTVAGGGTTSAQVKVTASVTDAALTAGAAKSLTASAGAVSNQVLGTFTDAAGAQASVADFTATVSWGDTATSSGTVSQTSSGAFNVNGTHTYTTGGAKTVKVVVKDQEGATVTLTASVTVPVLAQTGGSSGPARPLVPTMLLLLGALIAMVGVTLRLSRH